MTCDHSELLETLIETARDREAEATKDLGQTYSDSEYDYRLGHRDGAREVVVWLERTLANIRAGR